MSAAVLDPNCYVKFFNIDYDGIISLKEEYTKDGNNANKLPENIILPEIVNKTAVLGLTDGMVGVYDDFFTGAIPFQNLTGPDSDIIIVARV